MFKLHFEEKNVANNSFKMSLWDSAHKGCGFCWHKLDRHIALIPFKLLELSTSHSNWRGCRQYLGLTLHLPIIRKLQLFYICYGRGWWQWTELIQPPGLVTLINNKCNWETIQLSPQIHGLRQELTPTGKSKTRLDLYRASRLSDTI